MKEKKSIKAINFDLDTKALKTYYEKSRRNAYNEIGKFLKENGFYHRQWSGYVSLEKMTDMQMAKLNEKMWDKLPWLKDCARKFDVTDVGKRFDLIQMYKKQQVQDEKNRAENQKSTKDEYKQSMSEWKSVIDRPSNSDRTTIGLNKQNENVIESNERE